MSDVKDWQQGNDEYLAAALRWLRLRLQRLASPVWDQNTQPKGSSSVQAPASKAEAVGEDAAVEPHSIKTSNPHAETDALNSQEKPGWFKRFLGSSSDASDKENGSLEQSADEVEAETPRFEPKGEERLQADEEVSKATPITWGDIADAAEEMENAARIEPPPALMILSRRLNLSRFEQDVLLLCTAMELDTRVAHLCGLAQGNGERPYPTFALAMALFDEPSWDALSPHRPLRYWQLLEINQSGSQPLTTSPLMADERIVSFIKGLNYLDDRLAPLLMPMARSFAESNQPSLPPSHDAIVESVVRVLGQGVKSGQVSIIQLLGHDRPSKQLVAWVASDRLGLHLYRLPAEMLSAQSSDLETLARLWQRESLLLPLALYLDAQEVERPSTGGDGTASAVNRFLSRVNCVAFLDVREALSVPFGENVILDIAKPTPAEQKEEWSKALGRDAGDLPELLAGQFNLSLSGIRGVALAARSDASGRSLKDTVWQECLALTRPRLDMLAQRIDARASWEDLVLPSADIALLHQIAEQVRQRSKVYDQWGFRRRMNRGLGISALFAGESGTGKTMAAEVIANDLGLSLYRIDLSAVVSKYIGETEKNLRKLFDAAEDGGAILLFDEADALFGKRSEVRDSHDRYANIEINYLLQRIEAYRGLAILATNMKSILDPAFLRRLRFIVNFPFPAQTERKAIWQKVFPPEMPAQGLDFDRLARFNLCGGSIHNIAINAAFLAASMGTPVTMPLVLSSARTELKKLDRPVNEADFVWSGGAR